MSITSPPEPDTSDIPSTPPCETPRDCSPSDSAFRRFLKNAARRTQAFWTTRIVEGVLLKRQIEKLYLIMGGHIYFQTLSAAVQFDLFGLLKRQGPLPCSQIARQLDIQEKPARILLLGCTALGLLRKSRSLYSNSRLAERLLVRDAPGNIVSVIEWQHHINYRPMHSFYEALKANRNVGLDEFPGDEPTLYERLAHNPRLEKIFQDAMQAISVQANEMLARFVDFSGVRHVVDVGGGDGTNVIGLARKWPHLRATVFDSASVCEIAGRNVRAAGLEDRVETVAGNCFQDEFPTGADCFLFCHFFTIWSAERNLELLRKSYEALPGGGCAIVFNMMQRDDERGPFSAAMGSPYFLTLATGEGMLYTWQEYKGWMQEAGYANVRALALPRDHGAIIGRKP